MARCPNFKLDPAWSVACACGAPNGEGAKVLAQLAEVDRTTVYSWFRPVEKGGTGGLIPAGRQKRILLQARSRSIPLTADLIIGVRPDEQA